MLALHWQRSDEEDSWYDFYEVELPGTWWQRVRGVFIVWCASETPTVLLVGQGDIRSGVHRCRQDPRIAAYRSQGPIYVTWDTLDRAQLDGVERYLSEVTQPALNRRFLDAEPIAVTLPLRSMRAKSLP